MVYDYAAQRRYQQKRRAQRKRLVDLAKSGPCADCGNRFSPEAMDFDHVRGPKLFGIATGLLSKSVLQLEAEIAKCDIVCANCHRVRTRQRRLVLSGT